MRTAPLLLIASSLLCGCMTWVEVTKTSGPDDKATPGIRYALPVPFLVLTPRNDGGVDVAVKYLPDPDNEYAVRTWSLFSNYTLDLALEGGLLSQVTYKPNTTAVASQLVQTAGSLAQAKIEANAAAEKARSEQLSNAQAEPRNAPVRFRVQRP